jgi:hypothetical protein
VRPVAARGSSPALEPPTAEAPAAAASLQRSAGRKLGSRPSRRLIGGVTAVLVVVGVAVGVALAASSSSKHANRRVLARVAQAGGAGSSTPAPSTSSSPAGQQQGGTSPNAASATPSSSGTPAPLAAVERYWADIGAQDYAGAYGHLLAGSIGLTESQFISSEQSAGIEEARFRGRFAAGSGSTATVDVRTLVTNDAQYGCRTWTGSYEMTDESGAWLIARANLSPHPCSG